ncbi:MAG: tRNA-uridine aminocarboxypropyltransferase [Byssovorax sp.]
MLIPDSPPAKPMRSRRTPRCPDCWLPSALCLCAELPRLAVRTRVVVAMHRREAVTSSNTGRLAARVLDGASVRVRGLAREREIDPEPLPPGRRLVLFPAAEARLLTAEDAVSEGVVLLVPDGTWAQARRLLRRDDLFQGAEVVTLPPAGPSRYGLRRHAREGSVCTLEAVGRALGVLEGGDIEERLAAVLERFVARSRQARTGHVER